MQWEQAARWIVRACRAYRPAEDHEEEEDEGDADGGCDECELATWSMVPPGECEECRRCQSGREVVASNALAGRLQGPAQRDAGRRLPALRRRVHSGQSLGTLYGTAARGPWPLARSRWWPRPRVVEEHLATANWITTRCHECGEWRATLVASVDLPGGEEVTTGPRTPIVTGHEREWPIEISFDGGARLVNGRRVAGAGVVVWGPLDLEGTRSVMARAVVAIPSHQHAAYAEAYGCYTALRWVVERGGDARTVRIAGDNLAVLRFCANVGRLRRPVLQGLLEGPLADAYARGWHIDWVAVRRRFNQEADGLATAGVHWARRLAADCRFDTVVRWE